jgi:hypothetical protein
VDLELPGAGRRALRRLAAGGVALLVAAGCTAPGPDQPAAPSPDPSPAPGASAAATTGPPPAAAGPRYLQGQPLTGPTRLWLLVASDPPRLVDVDRGTSRPVDGLPTGDVPFSVAAAGEDAIIAADRQVFVLERWSPRARPVGAGDAMPSLDGRGIWLLERGRRCTLRQIGLDSLARRPPRRVPCTIGLLADTPLGLLVWTEPSAAGEQGALVDLGSGRVVARYPEVHGVVGSQVLWGGPERHAGPFTLTDRRVGTSRPVPRPTPYGAAGSGLPSPDGRLLAVEFADLSWSRVKGQVSDIWLLDLRTRRWRRLPGMPLITAVKFMSMAWTADGRLLLAGDFDRFGKALAIWRPGQDHLAVKRLPLPDPAGSDSFVPWPAPA